MFEKYIFDFEADLSEIPIPEVLNNPFDILIPEITVIAATEFQQYLSRFSEKFRYDFAKQDGKMFGVLVVRRVDKTYGYLGTYSGSMKMDDVNINFVPSIFDDSVDDYFINKGMAALSEMTQQIKLSDSDSEVSALKEKRKQKSKTLQEQLFNHYDFLNIHGERQNIITIFENSSHGKPPSAAGDCAAPKLLQYAFEHSLEPISLAEFWWGNSLKSKKRKHKSFYPACKNKCRPILEFMLDDTSLFDQANN